MYISHRKHVTQFLPCSGRGGRQKLGGCRDENTCVWRASWKWYLSKLEFYNPSSSDPSSHMAPLLHTHSTTLTQHHSTTTLQARSPRSCLRLRGGSPSSTPMGLTPDTILYLHYCNFSRNSGSGYIFFNMTLLEVEMEILGLSRHGKPLISRERAGSWDSKTPTMSF